ncbi:MAG: YbgC/FadM family acyl-CoA thioesterase [Acidobacteria bacterium]|jgi:tol-pal system-associated acyl-CoA thioesterase|nr:YbgC/FadM family acyl-CoA thioesterase [Acidobacteriota bacterium]
MIYRMPEPPPHVLPVRVYLEDTDAQGFVYHANYLRFFERARSEILDAAGYPMREIAEGSHRFVVYDMKIRFRTPARLGDRLEIRTRVERTSGYRVTFRHEATRAGDPTTLATADVDVVSLDASGKLQELPAALSAIWRAADR